MLRSQVDDLHVKVVKVRGEFVWHTHDDNDEMFLVRTGSLTIEDVVVTLADTSAVTMGYGTIASRSTVASSK